MRGYLPTNRERARELRLVNDPTWQAEGGHVREILLAFREAASHEDLLRAQVLLVGRISARQEHIAELKARADVLRGNRTAAIAASPRELAEIRRAQRAVAAAEWWRDPGGSVRCL